MAKLKPGMVQLEATCTVTILGQTYRKGEPVRPVNQITANNLLKKNVVQYPKPKQATKSKEQKTGTTNTKEAKPFTKTKKGAVNQTIKNSD